MCERVLWLKGVFANCKCFRGLAAVFLCFIIIFSSTGSLLGSMDGVEASPSSILDSLLANSTSNIPPSANSSFNNSEHSSDENENLNSLDDDGEYSEDVSDEDLLDEFNDLSEELNATSKAKKGSVEQYSQASASVANTVEHTKKLPKNVTVGNKTVNMPGYLDGATKQIINIKNKKTNNTVTPVDQKLPTKESTDEIPSQTIAKQDYLTIITKIHKYMNEGLNKGRAPNHIIFKKKAIGYENLVYITSQILYSYGMTQKLPDYIIIYPWNTITKNSTFFIPMAGISTATDTITSYVQTQHKLPSTITVANQKLNMATMLKLEARALLNLQSNLYQSVLLKGDYKVPRAHKVGDPYPEDNIDGLLLPKKSGKHKGEEGYSDLIVNVNDYMNTNDLTAPNCTFSIRGNIGFYSLVYLFADLLNSAVHNNQLPANIPLVSWKTISNHNIKFLSMDQINTAAEAVKDNVETQKKLPDTIKIGGLDVKMSNFLYLLVKSLKNIDNGYYGSIILSDFGDASKPSEKIKKPGIILQSNYLNVADNTISFMTENKQAPNFELTSEGNMRFENLVFMYSQILTYTQTNNNLPYYVGVHPWTTITSKSTVYFTPSQIVNSAVTVQGDIERLHNLPDKVMIDGHSISLPAYLKLLTTTINILGGTTASQIIWSEYTTFKDPKSHPSKKYGATLDMTKYLQKSGNVAWSICLNQKVATIIKGVRYENWVYVFSQILSSYKSKNSLPSLIMVTPWSVVLDQKTHFFHVDDIAVAADYMQKYVEVNHKIPTDENAVTVAGVNMTTSTFLKLLTMAILNIDGNLNSTIISKQHKDPKTATETIHPGNNNKTVYINVLKHMKTYFDDNKIAQEHSSYSTLGTKICFANLVYTYSQLLNSYRINNNTLPDHITINTWNTIKNSEVFVTTDQVIKAATVITMKVEQNHQLPSTVKVGETSVKMATFLRILTTAIWNIQGNLNTTIPIKTYNATKLTEETLHPGIMDSEEYLRVLEVEIKNNFDLYDHVIDTIPTNNGRMGFNNSIYLYSQLLVSFTKSNNTLPDLVAVTPWAVIAKEDTKFFTMDQVQAAAKTVKTEIETNNMPPQNVKIDGTILTMPTFLKVLSQGVRNAENNLYASVTYNGKVEDPTHPNENITVPGTLDSDDLSDIAIDLVTNMENTQKAPDNIQNTGLGTIGYYTLLSTFSNVMTSYNITKPKNNSVLISPSISWFNPDGIFNYRTGKIFKTIQEALKDKDTRSGDTIWVGKKQITENIVINKKVILRPVYGVNVTITPLDINLPVFTITRIGNSSTIQGLKITDALFGILLDNSNKNQILANNITGNTYGIRLDESNNNVISGNSIINNNNGIIIRNSLDNTISVNNISSNRENGISLVSCTNNTVYSNNIMKNGNGVYLSSSPGKVIFNQIMGNTLYGLYNTGSGVVNATNNWWGTNKPVATTNTGTTSDICNNQGTLNYDPYIVLTLTHSTDRSNRKNKNYNYIIKADLNHDNHGKNTTPEGTVPDDIPINFLTNLGTLTNSTSNTKKGRAGVMLNSTATGVATITATLDLQTTTNTVSITPVTTQSITNTRTHTTYNTIQEAINDPNTQNGDTITLAEGTYTENIIINKKITLTKENGADATIRFKDENKGVIVIGHDGSGTVIQNLNIVSSSQSYGIATSHAYNCVIKNNIITEAMKGIYLYMSGNNTITENNVIEVTQGIILYKSISNTLTGNLISRNEIGLVAETSTFNTIKGNTIQDNYYGSRISDSNSNTINTNNIKGNYVAVYLYNTNNNLLDSNSFVENGVGVANCNAIDDNIRSTNTFKDNYLADQSFIESGDYTLATTIYTCGPAAFATVYNHLGGYTTEGEIAKDAKTDETGTSLQGLQDAANKRGMKSVGAKNVEINQLKPYYIIVLNIDDTNHFVVYLSQNNTTVTVFDPNLGTITMNMTQFQKFYNTSGQTIFILNNNTIPPGATALSTTEMREIKALYHWDWVWHTKVIPAWIEWVPFKMTFTLPQFYWKIIYVAAHRISWGWFQITVPAFSYRMLAMRWIHYTKWFKYPVYHRAIIQHYQTYDKIYDPNWIKIGSLGLAGLTAVQGYAAAVEASAAILAPPTGGVSELIGNLGIVGGFIGGIASYVWSSKDPWWV